MSAAKACPSQQELSDYLLGRLDDSKAESISDHLQACGDCFARLDLVDDSQDPMVRRLRHPQPDDDYMKEPECRMAVENGLQLARLVVKDVEVLRDYRFIGKLGEGGMGTVYRAVHTNLDREVAVKLLPAGHLPSDQAVNRFKREMKAIGRLNHPNIVRAYDAGEADGRHYLVMELVDGLDLSTLVQRLGPLPVADACEIIRQAALGLQHAHEHQLIHRDIKPSNIMLTPAGQVKVLDLGLARLQDPPPDGRELTSTGQIMGTLDYMAPEQLGESHLVDIRADIYSLGATLYKLLTGRAPHADKRYNTPQQKLMAIATKPVQPVTGFRVDIAPGVMDVLDRMLAKDPDQRFSTPVDVARALEEQCRQADLPARLAQATEAGRAFDETEASAGSTFAPVASSFTDTHPSHIDVQPAPATSREGAWWHRRSRILLAAALLAFFGVVLTVFYIRSGKALLVVEVDDEAVAVELKKSGLTVTDRETGETYEVRTPGETQLAAGQYELSVTNKSGLKVSTPTFTLTRGGREIVRIALQKDEAIVEKRPPTPDEPVPGPIPQPSAPVPYKVVDVPDVPPIQRGDPISPAAVVGRPTRLDGLLSWTIETRGHRSSPVALAYNRDGTLLASGGSDGTIRIWDSDTKQLRKILLVSAQYIGLLRWSPDDMKLLAVSHEDALVTIWDPRTGRQLKRMSFFGVSGAVWGPDSSSFAVATENSVLVVDSDIKEYPVYPTAEALSWAVSERLLVVNTGTDRRRLEVRNLFSDKESRVLDVPFERATGPILSPDGMFAAAGGAGHDVAVWNLQTGERFDLSLAWNRFLMFSADNCLWSWSGNPAGFIQWRFDSAMNVHETLAKVDEDGNVFCEHGGQVAFGGYIGGFLACIKFWDLRNDLLVGLIPGCGEAVSIVSLSPNGEVLAARLHTTARLGFFDLVRGEAVYSEKPVSSAEEVFSWRADGRAFFYGVNPFGGAICDPGSGKVQQLYDDALRGHVIRMSAWSPDAKKIALACSDGVFLLDVDSKAISRVEERSSLLVAWSPDGSYLAVGDGGTVRIWNLQSEKLVAEFPGGPIGDWSRERNLFACWNPVNVWDAQRESVITTGILGSMANGVTWLKDNGHLLTASGGPNVATLSEWDDSSGALVDSRKAPSLAPAGRGNTPVSFSEDGQILAVPWGCVVKVVDTKTGLEIGAVVVLFPDKHLIVNSSGHYVGSPGVEDLIVYVVQTEDGQETLTPEEFSKKYGWKNDPSRAPFFPERQP